MQLAIGWARASLWLATRVGIVAVSVATPLASSRIFDKWFSLPDLLWLAPIPLLTVAVFNIRRSRPEAATH